MTDAARPGLRVEIQLLRALAVMAVVLNHLVPQRLHGGYLGVDIFFVISGYLISSHLLRELDREGKVRLGRFWARRARRLLPASLLVLVLSAIATVLVVPATMWSLVMKQISACALYVQNWSLAHDALDYFTSSNSPSPVTHYWSLSVEEQFYLVWPLLTFGAFWLGRRRGRPHAAVLAIFAVVVAASLAFSIYYTAHSPKAAYFVTPTRMWELGTGGLMAFVPTMRHRGRHGVAALGWIALVGSVVVYQETWAIPGWLALVPVLGAAAVIVAGDAFVRTPPRVVLPLIGAGVWIGGISYSLYLWHWPLIVLTPYATDHPNGPLAKLLILAASIGLAYVSLKLVEDPVRSWRPLVAGRVWRTLVPAALAMAVVVGLAQFYVSRVDDRVVAVQDEMRAAAAKDPCFGAAAMVDRCAHPHRLKFRDAPLVTVVNQRLPGWGHYCQQTPTGTEVVECQFGVPADQATKRFALVGDSHAGHWYGALQVLAQEHHWNITMMAKSSCAISAEPIEAVWDPTLADSCHTWSKQVVRRVAADPDLDGVFMSEIGRRYRVQGAPDADQQRLEIAGYQAVWRRWTQAGKSVAVIGDVPQMNNGDIPTCVGKSGLAADPCTTPVAWALAPDPLLLAAEGDHDPSVTPVDLHRYFCDAKVCHSVIGGIVAYGDANHVLALFSASLAPYLDRQLTAGPDAGHYADRVHERTGRTRTQRGNS
ncbi:acyltransferase family protein [Nocardioides montaniterrae]